MMYQFIIYAVTAILLILIILKTVLFSASTTNKSLYKWFYFSHYSLYNSRSEKSRRQKLLQNKLTIIIFAVAVIDMVLIAMFRKA
ncbi:hypothetical protein [Parafilimonas sp.]|uniref:hypothetical protein n=1 Tax=Parafilimonas sp. TaxID=1969739 RepID=UPI0039E3BB03